MYKKVFFAFVFLASLLSFSDDKLIDKMYYGITAQILEKFKSEKEAKQYLEKNKSKILNQVTNKIYSVIESDYASQREEYISKLEKDDIMFNKYAITVEEDTMIYEKVMSDILNKYGYFNTIVSVSVNMDLKFVDVTIFSTVKLDNYDKQIFNLLITNMAKAITTEEYQVNIFEK